MAESIVQVTEGTGKKLHTWSRTVGANTVEDEAVFQAEYPLATYTAYGENLSGATANDHLVQLMAGASLYVRVRRILVQQNANATTVARAGFQLLRLTTAGTGGGAVTPAKADTADAAAGAAGMTLPTVKGTESTIYKTGLLIARQAYLATASQQELPYVLYEARPDAKPLIIPTGATNGIAIKSTSANAASTWNVWIEFVETSFL